MLAGLKGHQTRNCCGCEQRLPWSWTEEAAPRTSQQLGLLAFQIACMVLGIALCWCWQCLLTVGGNLLPHIITHLGVTTVAWCCRHNRNVLHPAECSLGTLQISEWRWSAGVFTSRHCVGSFNHLFTAKNCLQHNLTLWFGSWTVVHGKCLNWYSTLRYINYSSCQSVLHIRVVINERVSPLH